MNAVLPETSAAEPGAASTPRRHRFGTPSRIPLVPVFLAIPFLYFVAPFTISYVHRAVTGRWRVPAYVDHTETLVYSLHTAFALLVFGLLITQMLTGAATSLGWARRWTGWVHRALGLWVAGLFAVLALDGTLLEAWLLVSNPDGHKFLVGATILFIGLFTPVFFVRGAWRARKGDLVGHLDDIVFGTLMMASVGLLRLVVTSSRALGNEKFTAPFELLGRPVLWAELEMAAVISWTVGLWLVYAARMRCWGTTRVQAFTCAAFLALPVATYFVG